VATDFRLRIWPDPILSVRCEPVNVSDLQIDPIDRMIQTVHDHNALGIAANQIGWDRRVIVARLGDLLEVMINPMIKDRSGARRMNESCLSIPGLVVPVTRAETITVSFNCLQCLAPHPALTDPDHEHAGGGRRPRLELSGLEAAIVQREIDHLDGKTLADHPHARRGANRDILAKLKAQAKL